MQFIRECFESPKNTSAEAVCRQIAANYKREMFKGSENKDMITTEICALFRKASFAFDSAFNQVQTGVYIEFNVNSEYVLVIKMTYTDNEEEVQYMQEISKLM